MEQGRDLSGLEKHLADAVKYVETLQRSNEQLVKVCAILHKQGTSPASLSETDKDELFDMIQGSK